MNGLNFKNMQNKIYKILLLSGGADSMLLYQRYKYDKIVFFNYGQEHKEDEFINCKDFINDIIELPKFAKKNKEINCRNFTFISLVSSVYGDKDIEIHIGTNKEDIYKDNSRLFYNDLEKFINLISLNKIIIQTPLINMTKKEILKELNFEYFTD